MYRVGLPLWRTAALLGIPLSLRLYAHHDPESNSFWCNSPDLPGFIIAGETIEEMRQEVRLTLPDFLGEVVSKRKSPVTTELCYRDTLYCPA